MLVVIGLTIGSLLWRTVRSVRILYRRGVRVTGRVVSVKSTPDFMSSTISYLDPQGVERLTSWGYEIGDDYVELLVDPDNPKRVTIATTDELRSTGNRIAEIVMLVIAVVSFAAAIVGVVLIAGALG